MSTMCSRFTAKFDPWFAKLAEDAGAVVINRTTADDVIKENGRVIGVKTERGELRWPM